MKKFMAIFVGTQASHERSKWDSMDEAQRKEREQAGMEAWGKWMTEHEKSLVDTGGPLGKTKRIAAEGVSDSQNTMTGYVIVQADSHEAAAKFFENHPHFMIFPGDSVEVMECMPIPKI